MDTRPVALCAECGLGLRPGQPDTYREIHAREQVTRTGGPGRLRDKKYTGKVWCRACVDLPTDTLFGASP